MCNGIRESDVRRAVRAGSRDPHCAYARLDCAPQCGQCLDFADEVIHDEVARATVLVDVAA